MQYKSDAIGTPSDMNKNNAVETFDQPIATSQIPHRWLHLARRLHPLLPAVDDPCSHLVMPHNQVHHPVMRDHHVQP